MSHQERSPLPFNKDVDKYVRFCWRAVSGRSCNCSEVDEQERPCLWCECKRSIRERSKL